MCGIAGLIDSSLSPDGRSAAVGRMGAAMIHRGPDDLGIESLNGATLGVRRLAVFDPANGHQPMRSADGRFTIAFNGAIYNFKALRGELSAAGWAFRTECDTEVLLAAYATWGQRCLNRLRGMFAFAVWDDREQALVLARDPFGIKPLYYRHEGDRLIFASELNALGASGIVALEGDPISVADYLSWLAVPAPRTIYKGVFSLRPGECAFFCRGRFEVRSSWSFRKIPRVDPPCATREDFIRQLRERLDDSTRAHLLADVPVGAFLSGGLDSAAIVGLMTRASGARLKTFTIGFEDAAYSEAGTAEETARFFGTDHHTHLLTGAQVAGDIDRYLAACDQPTGDGLNTYYASQAAHAGGVTVALSGLGGDELFGGYPSFSQVPVLAARLRWWWALPGPLRRAVVFRLRRGDTRRQKLADVLESARDVHEIAALQRRVFSEPRRRGILSPAARGELGRQTPFHPELGALRMDLDPERIFRLVSAWELRTYMADVLLRDSDVMSMRHSLELRVPFIDRPLIEWLWRQPSKFKSTPREPKSVLVAAMGDLLPPGLATRPKQGFTLPMDSWMRRELKPFLDETFSDASIDRSGLFNRATVQEGWRQFIAQRDPREWSRVWSLGILVGFVNRRQVGLSKLGGRPVEVRGERSSSSPAAGQPARAAHSRPVARSAGGKTKGDKKATLLLTPEIFASVGGIARMTQLYLKALSELAVTGDRHVRLLALRDGTLDSGDARRYSAGTLNDWFVCSGNKRRFVREALRMSRGSDRLVCCHVAQLPVAWAASRLHPRLRYYLVAHGLEVWRPFTFLERVALRRSERIFCVSDFTRGELLKHCPLPEGRAVILPNTIDTSTFSLNAGRPLAECPPVILTVSRLSYADRYKGVEHLIAAMPGIRAAVPGALLRVVGRGDDLPRLQGLSRKLGLLGSGVEFLGPTDDPTVLAEMQTCRLFALPSGREGFGLVFLEAMAQGRPCVGARAGAVPELLTPEVGMLAEFGDVAGISAACVTALGREWDQEKILARARLYSYEKFRQRLGELLA